MMSRWAILAGGVLADLVGTIWLLQGLNIVGGSRMTGDPLWAVLGSVLIVVGTVIVALTVLRGVGRARS